MHDIIKNKERKMCQISITPNNVRKIISKHSGTNKDTKKMEQNDTINYILLFLTIYCL